ncbi:PRTRC system protein F [Caballeronia sp. LZ002]|uniref:PRTRC system protein F n=2 Tax=Caballeronia TaxID=1827195 RepID=UPI00285F1147|nr:PRTRC system protein F [Caballeronia sp. LZ002]MDR5776913.1 PRTRC system protein F [Caballeronia sp. LZ002]MDR5852302.1 PRTRC system protein F [Caballeronia sp. LZ003]
MFFDPRATGSTVADSGEHWQPPRSAAAGHRSADDFLTLPALSQRVPGKAVMQWGASPDLTALAQAHFESGCLRARDVPTFQSAGDALAHGFFGFAKRHRQRWNRLELDFTLCDVEAVREQIQYHYDAHEFTPTSSLYLGIENEGDQLWQLDGHSTALRRVHPRLLQTVLVLINRASSRTVWIRTPDEFLGMFAQFYWDGDPHAADEEVVEVLKDRFGDEEDAIEHFLPSTVRDELCPADIDVGTWSPIKGRWIANAALGIAALRRIRRFQHGWIRRLCLELETLTLLLQRAGRRSLFDYAVRPEAIYPACSLIAQDNEHIGDLLDSHYEYFNSGGDGSVYLGFVPFAQLPDDIRRQYADWALGLSILNCVDRVLTLVTR